MDRSPQRRLLIQSVRIFSPRRFRSLSHSDARSSWVIVSTSSGLKHCRDYCRVTDCSHPLPASYWRVPICVGYMGVSLPTVSKCQCVALCRCCWSHPRRLGSKHHGIWHFPLSLYSCTVCTRTVSLRASDQVSIWSPCHFRCHSSCITVAQRDYTNDSPHSNTGATGAAIQWYYVETTLHRTTRSHFCG